jgi:hypothetical protein
MGLTETYSHKIIIFDDLLGSVLDSAEMNHFMIFQSRRVNISVIFVTQNTFSTGRFALTQRRHSALRKY